MTVSRAQVMNVVTLLVVVGAVVPFAIYAVPGVVGADESYVVLSGSMSPTIDPGDVVVVTDVPAESIEEGDVITFWTSEDGPPTTHRVVGIQESEFGPRFLTKGDANEDRDTRPVPPGNVVGEVTLVIPYIGHVIAFGQSPVGFVLFVVSPLVLLVLTELRSLLRAGRDDGADDSAALRPGATPTGVVHPADRDADASRATPASDASAASTPAPESQYDVPEYDAPDDDPATLTITPADVRFTAVVLLLVAGYAGWVAYRMPEAWSISVAVAASLCFLFTATIARRGGETTSDEAHAPTESRWSRLAAETTVADEEVSNP